MTNTMRQLRTFVLIGAATVALATTGVGLALSLSAGPADAESLPTGASTTVVQPQDATFEGGIGRDTSSDTSQCLPLLVPRSDDPSRSLFSPKPDPAPPVCNGGESQTP